MSQQTLPGVWAFRPREAHRNHRFVVGLLGSGIGGSLTPGLHEAEADRLGLAYTYRVIDLDALGQPAEKSAALVRHAADLGFDGLNVTHPSKQLVQDGLDELSPEARILGAVNTITFHDGKTVGHNTDHTGFIGGLRAGLPSAATGSVVQIGAGEPARQWPSGYSAPEPGTWSSPTLNRQRPKASPPGWPRTFRTAGSP